MPKCPQKCSKNRKMTAGKWKRPIDMFKLVCGKWKVDFRSSKMDVGSCKNCVRRSVTGGEPPTTRSFACRNAGYPEPPVAPTYPLRAWRRPKRVRSFHSPFLHSPFEVTLLHSPSEVTLWSHPLKDVCGFLWDVCGLGVFEPLFPRTEGSPGPHQGEPPFSDVFSHRFFEGFF